MSDRWEKSDIDMMERREGDTEFQQVVVVLTPGSLVFD
jgi:hypothetical protein